MVRFHVRDPSSESDDASLRIEALGLTQRPDTDKVRDNSLLIENHPSCSIDPALSRSDYGFKHLGPGSLD